jgi:predicted AAA+ superfamily ATPase
MMYFKGRGECDFVVQEGTRLSEAWQVCWELAGKTGERELNGLAEARRELKIGRGAILTYDQESAGSVEGKTIRVVPVWKWLLGR